MRIRVHDIGVSIMRTFDLIIACYLAGHETHEIIKILAITERGIRIECCIILAQELGLSVFFFLKKQCF